MSKNEYKAAAKVRFAAILSAITDGLDAIDAINLRAAVESAVYEVRIGMALDLVRDEMRAAKAEGVSLAKVAGIGTDDWREYARTNVPGKSNGTLYRWQNAGAVARVLGDSLVGGTFVGGLAHLYRGLSSAKTDDERAAAEDLVREVYAEAVEAAGTNDDGTPIPPTAEDLLARAEAAFPSNRSGGGGGTTPTTTDEDESDEDESEDEDDESRRESSGGLVVVDAASVEAAHGPTDAIIRGLVGEFGTERATVVAIMLAAMRLATEHGPSVVAAVLASASGVTDEDEAAS